MRATAFPGNVSPDWLAAHSRLLADSYRHWTGEDLVSPGTNLAEALWLAPFVLVSHNGAADPILNYGNQTALGLWEMDWADFTRTPSRYTAEPDRREARSQMLEKAGNTGVITDYSGIRISASGRRFMIRAATVWTIVTDDVDHGQAAMFRDWEFLED